MIAIGCDHGGYELKKYIMQECNDIDFKDFGTFSEESMDFPDVAFPLAESVANGECEKGILICRSGIGMTIAANKVKGIRCALCYNVNTAKTAKAHNNANVIAIGADEVSKEVAYYIIQVWLETEFLGGKYQKRLDKIYNYEESTR